MTGHPPVPQSWWVPLMPNYPVFLALPPFFPPPSTLLCPILVVPHSSTALGTGRGICSSPRYSATALGTGRGICSSPRSSATALALASS